MAAQPERPWPGSHSLEVRWLFHGRLEPAVSQWFARFPAELEAREDTYLLHPHQHRVSVKFRGGRNLDVKVYRGSPGILDVPGRARGRMERWQKWSFPADPLGQVSADAASWTVVRKRRRISRFPPRGGGRDQPCVPQMGGQLGCAAELTEIRMDDEAWWTLGFEATGQASLLRGQLEATVAAVFSYGLPNGLEFRLDDSRSYAKWLWQWSGAERETDRWSHSAPSRDRASARPMSRCPESVECPTSSSLGPSRLDVRPVTLPGHQAPPEQHPVNRQPSAQDQRGQEQDGQHT
jgi:hypothetical protein